MWIQPQADLPGRDALEDAHVHVRRERLFLWLAAFFIGTATLLPLLGFSKWFGASWLPRMAGLEPPVMLLVPLGVVAFPVALLVLNLVGELYGKARARSLVFTLFVLWLGVLGLLWATDNIPDYNLTVTSAFFPSLALVGCGLLTLIMQVELFDWIGARWLRHIASPLIAIVFGFGAFMLASLYIGIPNGPVGDELLGVTLGAGGYTALAVLVGAIPVVLLARALSIYLRVELRQPAAFEGFDDDEPAYEPAFVDRRRHREPEVDAHIPAVISPRVFGMFSDPSASGRQRAWTSEEMAFFEAGEQQN